MLWEVVVRRRMWHLPGTAVAVEKRDGAYWVMDAGRKVSPWGMLQRAKNEAEIYYTNKEH